MTYYELVKKIHDLYDEPRNEQNIKELTNIKLENDNEYKQSRLAYHVYYFIKYRFNNEMSKTIDKIMFQNLDGDMITLELISLKKEMVYIKKIILLPVITPKYQDVLLESFDESLKDLNNTLYDKIALIDKDGTYLNILSKISINNLEV